MEERGKSVERAWKERERAWKERGKSMEKALKERGKSAVCGSGRDLIFDLFWSKKLAKRF